MEKRYIDFIHEAIANPDLAKELKEQSFQSIDSVKGWFAAKGIVLEEQEAESLYRNQENLKKAESPNY